MDKHSCAMHWVCIAMINSVIQCFGIKLPRCIGIKLLMISIIVQCIGIKFLMIRLVVQCIGIKLLMISIVVQ